MDFWYIWFKTVGDSVLICAADMAPKRAQQLEKLAELLGGSEPSKPAKKSKPSKKTGGDETPSTTTPVETDTPVETPVETPSEVDKPKKRRITQKGGDKPDGDDAVEPPPKATKVTPKAKAAKAKAAKSKAAKSEKPMPEPTWDNFTLLQEHFGLSEEECTQVLLRVCGPNPKGDKYWENFKVRPDASAPVEPAGDDDVEESGEDGEESHDGDGTPNYLHVNNFDGAPMSEDDPELEPKGPTPAIQNPDNMEVEVPKEDWCFPNFNQTYAWWEKSCNTWGARKSVF